MLRYADIVLPLAQPAYTFAVPEGMHVEAGMLEREKPDTATLEICFSPQHQEDWESHHLTFLQE